MPPENGILAPEKPAKSTRRDFLAGTAALALAASAFTHSDSILQAAGKPLLAYVGTYSNPEGPEGSRGHGEGIYLSEVDGTTGALKKRDLFKNDSNPAWLAFHPSRKYLYSADEITHYQGTHSGSISAYAVDSSNGRLKLLNTVSSEAAGPAHMSVHPSGRYALVANYAGGAAAVIRLKPNGELGEATDVKHDHGPIGPQHATSAPPGSFAISGHDSPHVHMIHSDPSGKFVLYTDLALDRIYVWKFDLDHGKLSPADQPYISLPPGDGPRHFAFHPNGRWMYCLQEEGSTLAAFNYDGHNGKLTARQTLSTLPKGFVGTNYPSEVVVSRDGHFVYAANRLHDSIAWFSISHNGGLRYAGEEWTRGDYPRSFNIDPSGRFLYSCNQRSDAVTIYRVNRQTGALSFTGQYVPVGTPACIVFL